jgi:hypothetical protein
LIRATTMRTYADNLTHGLDSVGIDPQSLQFIATFLAHSLFLLMSRGRGQGLREEDTDALASRVRHVINWIGQRQRFKTTGASADGHASLTYWTTHCIPEGGPELAAEQAISRKESRAIFGNMEYVFSDGSLVETKVKASITKKDKARKRDQPRKCRHCKKGGHEKSTCRAYAAGEPATK